MTPPKLAFLPDEQQTLLLRACLLDDAAGAEAFRQWCERVATLDTLDAGSKRLLPLLAARLTSSGADDSERRRILGFQRRAWVENNFLLSAIGPALQALADGGVPVLALKGLPLTTHYHAHISHRSMGDADLLVRRADIPAIYEILTSAGWTAQMEQPRSRAEFAAHHATNFDLDDHRGHRSLDIHWRLRPWTVSETALDEMWARAQAVEAAGLSLTIPGPADLLLHVLAHGAAWNSIPPIRWVADAAAIMDRAEIDWPYFLEQCERMDAVLPVRHTLTYLAGSVEREAPAEVHAHLENAAPSRTDAMVFARDQRPPDATPFGLNCMVHRHRAATMVGRGPINTMRYLHRMSAHRSPGETVRWVWRRIRQGGS